MVKNPSADAVDPSASPGLGRSPEVGHGSLTPVYLPGNPMDRGAWRVAVHGVTEELDTTE